MCSTEGTWDVDAEKEGLREVIGCLRLFGRAGTAEYGGGGAPEHSPAFSTRVLRLRSPGAGGGGMPDRELVVDAFSSASPSGRGIWLAFCGSREVYCCRGMPLRY